MIENQIDNLTSGGFQKSQSARILGCYNATIEKSGGVGDNPIGQTKSGKNVMPSSDHASHANFTPQDHHDAASIHTAAAAKAPSSRVADQHKEHAETHTFNADPKSKVIGKTQSGKNIHADPSHENHKKFTTIDHLDAASKHGSMGNKGAYKQHREAASNLG